MSTVDWHQDPCIDLARAMCGTQRRRESHRDGTHVGFHSRARVPWIRLYGRCFARSSRSFRPFGRACDLRVWTGTRARASRTGQSKGRPVPGCPESGFLARRVHRHQAVPARAATAETLRHRQEPRVTRTIRLPANRVASGRSSSRHVGLRSLSRILRRPVVPCLEQWAVAVPGYESPDDARESPGRSGFRIVARTKQRELTLIVAGALAVRLAYVFAQDRWALFAGGNTPSPDGRLYLEL